MIKWQPVKDEDDGLIDYVATVEGIKFHIIRSNRGFGLTAYRSGTPLHRRDGTSSISWLGTKKACVNRAENILKDNPETYYGMIVHSNHVAFE